MLTPTQIQSAFLPLPRTLADCSRRADCQLFVPPLFPCLLTSCQTTSPTTRFVLPIPRDCADARQNPISPEILRSVAQRVVAGDKNDHLLLPPEVEEAGPYEVPPPREVTGIEVRPPPSPTRADDSQTYVPAWYALVCPAVWPLTDAQAAYTASESIGSIRFGRVSCPYVSCISIV